MSPLTTGTPGLPPVSFLTIVLLPPGNELFEEWLAFSRRVVGSTGPAVELLFVELLAFEPGGCYSGPCVLLVVELLSL